jgi:hypothetical protein
MQAAIDRVIRSLTFKHAMPLRGPMTDQQTSAVRDEAMAFAEQLLKNYKGQLARRIPQLD